MDLTPRKLAVALYALAVLGAGLVVAGVAMIYVPAAFIIGGLAGLGVSVVVLIVVDV